MLQRRSRVLADLRVAGLVGDRGRVEYAASCTWSDIDLADVSGSIDVMAPDLVLAELWDEDRDRHAVHSVISTALAAECPIAVWNCTPSTVVLDELRKHFAGAEALRWFSVDPGVLGSSTLPGRLEVVALQHAASAASLRVQRAAWEIPVGVVMSERGGWGDHMSQQANAVLARLVRHHRVAVFAARGIDVPDGIECEGATQRGGGQAAFIARCGVIVGSAPPSASDLYTPAWAFDAVALGVPVVLPTTRGAALSLPRLTAALGDPDETLARVSELLVAGEVAPGRAAAGRVIVQHEHTYAHRLASIASTWGYRVLPPAPA